MNDTKTNMIKFRPLLLLAFLVSILSVVFYLKQPAVAKHADLKKQLHATLLNEPRPIQAFVLTGTDGTPFSQNNLRNHWTMIFFGFTHCGLVCPTTMTELSKMYRILEQKRISPLPQVVMISIDPKRDDLAVLRRYVTAFHPQFQGARGPEAMTRALADALGIAYARVSHGVDASPQSGDTIEHTGAVVLFNPDASLAGFFTTPHQASDLAADYELLIRSFGH